MNAIKEIRGKEYFDTNHKEALDLLKQTMDPSGWYVVDGIRIVSLLTKPVRI
jgi:hypothetical protein